MNEPLGLAALNMTSLGQLGPDQAESTAQRCSGRTGAIRDFDPEPLHGPYITLHQDTGGSGCFYVMVEELPAFIAALQALVPVVDQLASIKTP